MIKNLYDTNYNFLSYVLLRNNYKLNIRRYLLKCKKEIVKKILNFSLKNNENKFLQILAIY